MSGEEAPRKTLRKRRANVAGGRTVKHELWVSDEEEGVLLARSAAEGMTIPRYVMERALSDEGGETLTERRIRVGELLRTRRLLAADSNNLNQLTRRVNAGESAHDLHAQILHTLHAVDRVIETLDAVLRDEASQS